VPIVYDPRTGRYRDVGGRFQSGRQAASGGAGRAVAAAPYLRGGRVYRGGFQADIDVGPLLRAMDRAVAAAMNERADVARRTLFAFAHVDTGEMRRESFAEVGPAAGGRVEMVMGSTSDHAIHEVARGGDHDFIRRTADVVTPTILPALAGALRREGW
jgi:hypothetical protein